MPANHPKPDCSQSEFRFREVPRYLAGSRLSSSRSRWLLVRREGKRCTGWHYLPRGSRHLGRAPVLDGPSGLYLRDVQTNRPEQVAAGQLARIGKLLGTPSRGPDDQCISRDPAGADVSGQLALLGPQGSAVEDLLWKICSLSLRLQTLPDSLRPPHAFAFDSAGAGFLRNPRPLPGDLDVYPREGGTPERAIRRGVFFDRRAAARKIAANDWGGPTGRTSGCKIGSFGDRGGDRRDEQSGHAGGVPDPPLLELSFAVTLS
jgi:hypothetical protein